MADSVLLYKNYLKAKGFSERAPQKEMISFIDAYLDGDRAIPCMCEAGTGTGKTLGYSLPAISNALALGKKVVLSTATVALQDQILKKDLPDIRENSGLKFSYMVAKGKSNYFCSSKAKENMDAALYREIQNSINLNQWSGELSSLDDGYDIQLKDVTPVREECAGKFCPEYDECPYYAARNVMNEADVILTNHSFLLADLALGGGVILPEPSETIYALDEFHQFAHKTKDFFSYNSDLIELYNNVMSLRKRIGDNDKAIKALNIATGMMEIRQKLAAFANEVMTFKGYIKDAFKSAHIQGKEEEFILFQDGQLPSQTTKQAQVIYRLAKKLKALIDSCNEEMYKDSEEIRSLGEAFTTLQTLSGELSELAGSGVALWACYSRSDKNLPLARWITIKEESAILNVSPVLAGKALNNHLWKKAFGVVGCSATISANGDFTAFLEEIGTDALTMHVKSPYNYKEQGRLELIDFGVEPKDETFNEHTADYLKNSVDWSKGNLVLFTSFKQMKKVYAQMREQHEDIILQGQIPKSKMIDEHTRRIKAGQGSTIFGVETFAEGIDLQGDLLTHVVITRISFDAGNDPVSKTLSHYLKKQNRSPFNEVVIPRTCIKLIQAVGRLIRTEQDHGTVTILDNRLINRAYGQAILDSLPMELEEENIIKQAV